MSKTKFILSTASIALAIALTGCSLNSAEAYHNRGKAYYWKGDYDKAVSDYNEAIRLDPKFIEAYIDIAYAYARKGDYGKARGNFTKSLSVFYEVILVEYFIIDGPTIDFSVLDWRTDPNNVSSIIIIINGVFTDSRDGNKYKTVKIGNQTWMAENLNYDATGSVCYDNNSANCAKYGRLYNWESAMTACPSGWHLPSKSEWKELDEVVAGKKLKSKSGWNKNGNGTDEFGFSALPGGGGRSDGSFGSVGLSGFWWSSEGTFSRFMLYSHGYVGWYYYRKNNLFSVRCLQDYCEARR